MTTVATTTSKIKLGNLKPSKKFPTTLLEGAINMDIFQDEKVKGLIYEIEGKKYLNVKVVTRKEAKNGKTHYIEIDQFVPNQDGKGK